MEVVQLGAVGAKHVRAAHVRQDFNVKKFCDVLFEFDGVLQSLCQESNVTGWLQLFFFGSARHVLRQRRADVEEADCSAEVSMTTTE